MFDLQDGSGSLTQNPSQKLEEPTSRTYSTTPDTSTPDVVERSVHCEMKDKTPANFRLRSCFWVCA